MLDKSDRLERLVPRLARDVLDLDREAASCAVRAAHLCKADLATAMVAEMTSLQGVLGRIYARESGESEAVAEAIYEHHLPRFAGDALPQTAPGVAVGIADRLDTLAGLFLAGLQPTGARDPFALRRCALGLVQILVTWKLRVDLAQWLDQAARDIPLPFSDEALRACLEFVVARHEAALLAGGRRYDVVAAVLAAQGHDPAGAAMAVPELEEAVNDLDWPPVLQAYARCARIVRGQTVDGSVDGRLFETDAERGLLAGVDKIGKPATVGELVMALRTLVPPITAFFDKVLVMDESPELRANRLALVQRVVSLADGIADFSKLEGF
jgi:glycyl-tRNA synthetase